MSDRIIQMENVNKWFDDFQVLKDIILKLDRNKKLWCADHLDQENLL